MRTIIHDLSSKDIKKINFNKDDISINSTNCNNNCIGCFNCWIKHPKKCCINDNYNKIVDSIGKSNDLIIISKNRYGCYSNEVKKVFERCIGYVLPFFEIRNGKIHHMSRYDNSINFKVIMYGGKDNVEELVKANSINLNTNKYEIKYIDNIKEIEKCIH